MFLEKKASSACISLLLHLQSDLLKKLEQSLLKDTDARSRLSRSNDRWAYWVLPSDWNLVDRPPEDQLGVECRSKWRSVGEFLFVFVCCGQILLVRRVPNVLAIRSCHVEITRGEDKKKRKDSCKTRICLRLFEFGHLSHSGEGFRSKFIYLQR